jgi:hypothetical protein
MIKVTLMNKANLSIAGLALLIAGFGFLGGITTERVRSSSSKAQERTGRCASAFVTESLPGSGRIWR